MYLTSGHSSEGLLLQIVRQLSDVEGKSAAVEAGGEAGSSRESVIKKRLYEYFLGVCFFFSLLVCYVAFLYSPTTKCPN